MEDMPEFLPKILSIAAEVRTPDLQHLFPPPPHVALNNGIGQLPGVEGRAQPPSLRERALRVLSKEIGQWPHLAVESIRHFLRNVNLDTFLGNRDALQERDWGVVIALADVLHTIIVRWKHARTIFPGLQRFNTRQWRLFLSSPISAVAPEVSDATLAELWPTEYSTGDLESILFAAYPYFPTKIWYMINSTFDLRLCSTLDNLHRLLDTVLPVLPESADRADVLVRIMRDFYRNEMADAFVLSEIAHALSRVPLFEDRHNDYLLQTAREDNQTPVVGVLMHTIYRFHRIAPTPARLQSIGSILRYTGVPVQVFGKHSLYVTNGEPRPAQATPFQFLWFNRAAQDNGFVVVPVLLNVDLGSVEWSAFTQSSDDWVEFLYRLIPSIVSFLDHFRNGEWLERRPFRALFQQVLESASQVTDRDSAEQETIIAYRFTVAFMSVVSREAENRARHRHMSSVAEEQPVMLEDVYSSVRTVVTLHQNDVASPEMEYLKEWVHMAHALVPDAAAPVPSGAAAGAGAAAATAVPESAAHPGSILYSFIFGTPAVQNEDFSTLPPSPEIGTTHPTPPAPIELDATNESSPEIGPCPSPELPETQPLSPPAAATAAAAAAGAGAPDEAEEPPRYAIWRTPSGAIAVDNEAIQSDMLAYLVFILNGACMKIVEAPPINTRHVVERLQQGITHEELAQLLGRRRGRAMPPVVVDILKRLRTFFYMWQFVTVFERLPPEWQSTHEDLQAQIEDIRASTEDMRSGYTPNQQRWYAQLLKLFSTKYVTPAHPLFNLDINAHPRLRWAQVVGDREGMRHFVDTELRHFRQTGELTIEAKLQRWIEGEFDKLSSLEQRIIQGNKRAYQGTDAEWFLVMAYMYQTSFTDKEKMGVLASLSLRLWEFSMAVIEGEKA